MTNRHADGSICKAQTPESCPFFTSHVIPKTSADVSDALTKREELAAKPRPYAVSAFESRFAKYTEKLQVSGETPDVVANKTVTAKILAKELAPLGFYKEDNGIYFFTAGDRTTNYGSDDKGFWVAGKTVEEAAAKLRDPKHDLTNTEYYVEAGKNLRKFFNTNEDGVAILNKRNKATTKVWNDPKRFYNWDMDASLVGKMHAYGQQIDKQFPELDDKDKAIVLAQTMDKYERVSLERFRPGGDNVEWSSTVSDLWAGYKIFDNTLNK